MTICQSIPFVMKFQKSIYASKNSIFAVFFHLLKGRFGYFIKHHQFLSHIYIKQHSCTITKNYPFLSISSRDLRTVFLQQNRRGRNKTKIILQLLNTIERCTWRWSSGQRVWLGNEHF